MRPKLKWTRKTLYKVPSSKPRIKPPKQQEVENGCIFIIITCSLVSLGILLLSL